MKLQQLQLQELPARDGRILLRWGEGREYGGGKSREDGRTAYESCLQRRVHYRGCFRVSAQLTMTFLTVCPHLAHSTVTPGNFLDHLWAQHLLLYRC